MIALHRRSLAGLVGGLLAVTLSGALAGCGSAASSPGPAGSPGPSTPAVIPTGDAPTPVPVPLPSPLDGTGGDPGIPGGGGGSGPNPGTGVIPDPDAPGGVAPDAPPDVDPQPEPSLVTPVAGLTGVHPVAAAALDAALDGRTLTVRVAWWSGVEPCSVLAGVDVARDGSTFTLTVHEGSGGSGDLACIEIAAYKGSLVDLGELEPGDYTIRAFGDPPPLTVTVPG